MSRMQKVYSPGRLFYEDRFSYQLKLISFSLTFLKWEIVSYDSYFLSTFSNIFKDKFFRIFYLIFYYSTH